MSFGCLELNVNGITLSVFLSIGFFSISIIVLRISFIQVLFQFFQSHCFRAISCWSVLLFPFSSPPPPFFPRLLTPCLSPSLPVPLPHIYQIPPMCPMPFQAPWTDTVVNKTRTKFLPSKKKKKKILAPWNLFRWRHNAKQHKLS